MFKPHFWSGFDLDPYRRDVLVDTARQHSAPHTTRLIFLSSTGKCDEEKEKRIGKGGVLEEAAGGEVNGQQGMVNGERWIVNKE